MKSGILVFLLLGLFCNQCKKTSIPGTNEVFMDASAFDPVTRTVSAGTTITWTNKESIIHTVTSDVSGLFGSSDMNMDNTFSFTFRTAGTYSYHCTHHPDMIGKVIVN